MKRESRERIIEAYENASSLLGFGTLNSGLRYMREELERTLRILRRVRNHASLESVLAKEPEPTTEQLAAAVQAIELFPYQIRRRLPEAIKEAQKHLPREPGGRPQAVKPEEYPKVCEEIGRLFARGTPLKIAQERVAQRRGVSQRTIQRIWQNRKELAAVSQPVSDVETK
jgi:hypothetical protein